MGEWIWNQLPMHSERYDSNLKQSLQDDYGEVKKEIHFPKLCFQNAYSCEMAGAERTWWLSLGTFV
jgi:hypothetical protein